MFSLTHSLFWRAGCLLGASGVALGAYGSHGLPRRLVGQEERVNQWRTAVQYQMLHAVALLGISHAKHSLVASAFLTAGVVFFSGTIYARVLYPDKFEKVKKLAPTGGVMLILGWLALAL
ncbi:hypothetical protein IWQ61_010617 [Dispira simplex]|nr:hypothetical protein IWQ61_010617 [Dispira simplex]